MESGADEMEARPGQDPSGQEHGQVVDEGEHEAAADEEQTLYVQTVEAGEELGEHAAGPNTHIVHIIREGDYEDLDAEDDEVGDDDDDVEGGRTTTTTTYIEGGGDDDDDDDEEGDETYEIADDEMDDDDDDDDDGEEIVDEIGEGEDQDIVVEVRHEDEDPDHTGAEVQLVSNGSNGKLVHYVPLARRTRTRQGLGGGSSTTRTFAAEGAAPPPASAAPQQQQPALPVVPNASKKHICGEEGCRCAYRSKKSLVQHLNLDHGLKLATFQRYYGSVSHILYEFERIQRYGNYVFGADYKTFNSSTKQLRVIYVCAQDRKLRKNRQCGQVCTAYIEFAAEYNTGQGSLSGCLQHYKHTGYRDLSDYQFISAKDVPADFELICPICCETFATEEEMLQHAFEKIHHIAPRFIRMKKKNEMKLSGDQAWDNEVTNTVIRCDMCSFETSDRSYFMTHRVKSHMGPECIEKHVAKDREEANYIFRQAQVALNTRFFLANKRVNDSSIVSYSFRCNYNRRSVSSVCVCSFKMLEFPDGGRFEIEMVKVHSHDVTAPCEEELDDLPPPPELFSCETCDRVFQSEAILRDHQKANNHYNVVELETRNKEVVRPKQFFCSVCSVGFTKKLSLRQHQKNFNHSYTPANVRAPISSHNQATDDSDVKDTSAEIVMPSHVREKKVIQLFPHLCYDCGQTLSNKVDLLKHLNAEHGYEVDLFSKEFSNMDLVWRYFYEIQLNTKTRYKQHGSQKVDEDNFKIYYICNREGKDKTKKTNRMRGRRKPPKDVNRACTAHFTIRRDNGKITCTGSTTHYGHEIEEEFLLRGKILQKAMDIIQKVPEEAAEDMHVLTAADFPYHSEKREVPKVPYKNPDAIAWSTPFSDTFTVTPMHDDTGFYVGPTNKSARIVSHKAAADSFCALCAAKPSVTREGQMYQCPHIYQCDCDFYQAGYHNCKHINVLELYLNQESTQDVLYLTAPCSERDLAIRGQAAKLAQISEDVVKILENLNASEDSTKLLTEKMDAIKTLLATPRSVSEAAVQTDNIEDFNDIDNDNAQAEVGEDVVVVCTQAPSILPVVLRPEDRPRLTRKPLVVHPGERSRPPARKAIIVNNATQPPQSTSRLLVRNRVPTSVASRSAHPQTRSSISTASVSAVSANSGSPAVRFDTPIASGQGRRERVVSAGRAAQGATIVPIMALMQLRDADNNQGALEGVTAANDEQHGTAAGSGEQHRGGIVADEPRSRNPVAGMQSNLAGHQRQQQQQQQQQQVLVEVSEETTEESSIHDGTTTTTMVTSTAQVEVARRGVERRSIKSEVKGDDGERGRKGDDVTKQTIETTVEQYPLRKRRPVIVDESDAQDSDSKRTSHRPKRPNRRFDI